MSDASPRMLIGVDGGGSGCRAAVRLGPKGPLVLAEGGPANATTDLAQAIANAKAAMRAAAERAGATADDLAGASAHLGLAGVIDERTAEAIAGAMPVARCTVSDDRTIQVTGALGGRDGFVLAIGTGTIAASLKRGVVHGVGGWGFPLSDQGSGADIGRAALRRTLLCEDGFAPHSGLTRALLERLGGDAPGVVAFGARSRAEDYARLARDVVAAAEDGDEQGRAIMAEGAAFLDRALAVLGFAPGDRLCLTGGVGPSYRAYLAAAGQADLVSPLGRAIDGALALAAGPRDTMGSYR